MTFFTFFIFTQIKHLYLLMPSVYITVNGYHLYDQVQDSCRQLEDLEQLRDDLVHLVVHDMKSPLFGISGLLDLLQDDVKGKLDKKEMDLIELARESAQDLIGMIQLLMDIRRMEEGVMPVHKTECDLSSLTKDIFKKITSLAPEKKIIFTPPAAPITINGDGDLICRVITNLVNNALKFTSESGEVRVTLDQNKTETRLSLIANEWGIPSEYHHMLFEKSGRIKQKKDGKMFSTGLGLVFCKLGIEAHGGEIGIESDEDKGSTFWFTIPRL